MQWHEIADLCYQRFLRPTHTQTENTNMATPQHPAVIEDNVHPTVTVDDHHKIINRIETINHRAGTMVVDVMEEATARACAAMEVAATTVQMSFVMAAMRKRDEMLDKALTEIEERRIEIQTKLASPKLSKTMRAHYEKQLEILDDRETQTLAIYEQLNTSDKGGLKNV